MRGVGTLVTMHDVLRPWELGYGTATRSVSEVLPVQRPDPRRRPGAARARGLVVRIFIAEAVAHFTVAELHALVRFYSSPEGQSLMRKLAGFTRNLERAINTEIGSVP